jgi:RNA polymerase sporulation-specific sigma factor
MSDFRSYMEGIKGLPDLPEDCAKLRALVEKMRDGDKGAVVSLIESSLKHIAKRTGAECRRWNAWIHFLDLVQEANAEVVEKISGYDPDKACLKKFINFRASVAFKRYWHEKEPVHFTDYWRKITKTLRRTQEELTKALGRNPTTKELSEHLGMDESEVYAVQEHSKVTIIEIDKAVEDDNDSEALIHNLLISIESDPFQLAEAIELRERLVECLGVIDADLLLTYLDYGADSFRSAYSQAHKKEITEDNARKIKSRWVQKVKEYLRVK